MNVIILAGGYAERLWPLTENYPKTLLGIAGKPVLYHLLENLSRIPGVSSITIAIDEYNKTHFLDQIEDINIISTVRPILSIHSSDASGSIKGPLTKLAEILQDRNKYHISTDDFLIIGGDNVFGFSLERVSAFYRESGSNCIAVQETFEPIVAEQVGVPTIDPSGQIRSIAEKPLGQKVKLVSTACYCLKLKELASVADFLKQRSHKEELGRFFNWLAPRSTIKAFTFTEVWFDIGTRQGLLDANSLMLNGVSHKPALIFGRNHIVGPVFIGETATVTDSVIGPNVFVEDGCSIIGSKIENSIIYEGAHILQCDLKNSIVGAGSRIEGKVNEAVFGPKTRIIEGGG
jgi:glucose-1-phosphate thymidylyltransferase